MSSYTSLYRDNCDTVINLEFYTSPGCSHSSDSDLHIYIHDGPSDCPSCTSSTNRTPYHQQGYAYTVDDDYETSAAPLHSRHGANRSSASASSRSSDSRYGDVSIYSPHPLRLPAQGRDSSASGQRQRTSTLLLTHYVVPEQTITSRESIGDRRRVTDRRGTSRNDPQRRSIDPRPLYVISEETASVTSGNNRSRHSARERRTNAIQRLLVVPEENPGVTSGSDRGYGNGSGHDGYHPVSSSHFAYSSHSPSLSSSAHLRLQEHPWSTRAQHLPLNREMMVEGRSQARGAERDQGRERRKESEQSRGREHG